MIRTSQISDVGFIQYALLISLFFPNASSCQREEGYTVSKEVLSSGCMKTTRDPTVLSKYESDQVGEKNVTATVIRKSSIVPSFYSICFETKRPIYDSAGEIRREKFDKDPHIESRVKKWKRRKRLWLFKKKSDRHSSSPSFSQIKPIRSSKKIYRSHCRPNSGPLAKKKHSQESKLTNSKAADFQSVCQNNYFELKHPGGIKSKWNSSCLHSEAGRGGQLKSPHRFMNSEISTLFALPSRSESTQERTTWNSFNSSSPTSHLASAKLDYVTDSSITTVNNSRTDLPSSKPTPVNYSSVTPYSKTSVLDISTRFRSYAQWQSTSSSGPDQKLSHVNGSSQHDSGRDSQGSTERYLNKTENLATPVNREEEAIGSSTFYGQFDSGRFPNTVNTSAPDVYPSTNSSISSTTNGGSSFQDSSSDVRSEVPAGSTPLESLNNSQSEKSISYSSTPLESLNNSQSEKSISYSSHSAINVGVVVIGNSLRSLNEQQIKTTTVTNRAQKPENYNISKDMLNRGQDLIKRFNTSQTNGVPLLVSSTTRASEESVHSFDQSTLKYHSSTATDLCSLAPEHPVRLNYIEIGNLENDNANHKFWRNLTYTCCPETGLKSSQIRSNSLLINTTPVSTTSDSRVTEASLSHRTVNSSLEKIIPETTKNGVASITSDTPNKDPVISYRSTMSASMGKVDSSTDIIPSPKPRKQCTQPLHTSTYLNLFTSTQGISKYLCLPKSTPEYSARYLISSQKPDMYNVSELNHGKSYSKLEPQMCSTTSLSNKGLLPSEQCSPSIPQPYFTTTESEALGTSKCVGNIAFPQELYNKKESIEA